MTAKPDPELLDDENPELDEAWYAEAKPAAEVLGEETVRKLAGGRPRALDPKEPVKIRLARSALDHLRNSGPGWQTRVSEAILKEIAAGRL